MKPTRLPCVIEAKVDQRMRSAVEKLAAEEHLSLGESIRALLSIGIESKGLY